MKGKKVVVTGSAGFVGSYLVKQLEKEGAKVFGLDIINGIDITNWEKIKGIKDFDILYHLAAIMFVPFSYENPRKTYYVNTIGTLNMLELCRRNNAKMIFASSYIYGKPQYLPIDEEHPISSLNPYARSKIIGEELCKGYSQDHGVNIIILRPFNIYGKGQNEDFLIPSIINQAKQGLIQLKDPDPKRDFVHINDVIDAYIKAAQYNKSDFEVFNIGSGKSHSVREVVEIIVSNFKEDIKTELSGERRENEVMNTVADIRKAKKLLGWKPKINILEGLKQMI